MNILKYSAVCMGVSAILCFALVAITDSFSLGLIGAGIYSLVMLKLFELYLKTQELSSKEENKQNGGKS